MPGIPTILYSQILFNRVASTEVCNRLLFWYVIMSAKKWIIGGLLSLGEHSDLQAAPTLHLVALLRGCGRGRRQGDNGGTMG